MAIKQRGSAQARLDAIKRAASRMAASGGRTARAVRGRGKTFDEDAHPRVPAGEHGGGEFAPKDDGGGEAAEEHGEKPAGGVPLIGKTTYGSGALDWNEGQRIRDKLKEWSKTPPGNLEGLDQRARDTVFNNRHIIQYAEAGARAIDVRGVRDSEGNIQAIATVMPEKDHLYVEALATAPWNVDAEHDERKVRGAGSALLSSLIDESRKNGTHGRIELEALDDAVDFYRKCGFEVIDHPPNKLPRMALSPEAAELFQKRVKSKYEKE